MSKIVKFYIDNCAPCSLLSEILEMNRDKLPEIISINISCLDDDIKLSSCDKEIIKKYVTNVPRLYVIDDNNSFINQLDKNYYDINNIYKFLLNYDIDYDF